ncbi:MAG: hypothetical protein ACJ8OJ_19580 [Povalibacter sp.]
MSISPSIETADVPEAAPVKEKKSRIPWTKIILESFFVMLGVLTALIADEWRQNHDDEKRADRALASVIDELNANRASVVQSLTYHLELTRYLRRFEEQAQKSPASAVMPDGTVFKKGFLHPASLTSTAWDSAKTTDAVSHMQYERVLTLAHTYDEQRAYADQSHEVEQLIFAKLFNEGFEATLRNHANLLTVISTFWFRECQLAGEYDRVLSQLGTQARDPSPLPQICEHARHP